LFPSFLFSQIAKKCFQSQKSDRPKVVYMECISTISGQRRRNPKFFCCFATNVLVFTYFFWDCCWNAGI